MQAALLFVAIVCLSSFAPRVFAFGNNLTENNLGDGDELLVPAGEILTINEEDLPPEPTDYKINFCPGNGEVCSGTVTLGGVTYTYNGSKAIGGKDYTIVY